MWIPNTFTIFTSACKRKLQPSTQGKPHTTSAQAVFSFSLLASYYLFLQHRQTVCRQFHCMSARAFYFFYYSLSFYFPICRQRFELPWIFPIASLSRRLYQLAMNRRRYFRLPSSLLILRIAAACNWWQLVCFKREKIKSFALNFLQSMPPDELWQREIEEAPGIWLKMCP